MKSKTLKGLSLALALTLAVGCMPGIDVSAKAKKAEVKTTKTVTKSKKTTTKTQKAEVKAAKADTASNKGAYGPGKQTIANGTYYIMTGMDTSYGLDLSGNKTESGTNVQLYKQSQNDVWAFEFTYMNDGYYKISVPGKGTVLDVSNGGSADGTNVQIWTDNGTDAQRWVVEETSNGFYYIKSKISGKPLDVNGGSCTNKQNIIIYTAHGGKNQLWKLVPDSYGPGTQTVKDGEYRIMTGVDTNYGLDLKSNSHDPGTNVQLYKVSANDVPLLEVTYQNNGYYTIGLKGTEVVIEVVDGGKFNGANIALGTKNGSDKQLWVIEDAGSGFYFVRSKLDGRCMDVQGAAATNNANIHSYEYHGGKNQQWMFVEEPTTKLEGITAFSIVNGLRIRWTPEGDLNNRIYKLDKTFPKGSTSSTPVIFNPLSGVISSTPDGVEIRYRENEEGSEWEEKSVDLAEGGDYADVKGLTGGAEYIYTVRPYYYYKILGISIGIKNYKQPKSKEQKRTTMESNEGDINIGDNVHNTIARVAKSKGWIYGMHQQYTTGKDYCMYDMVCKNKEYQIWVGYQCIKGKVLYSWRICDYKLNTYKWILRGTLADLKKDLAVYAPGSTQTKLSTEFVKYVKGKEVTIEVKNSSKSAKWSLPEHDNARIKYAGVEIVKQSGKSVTIRFTKLKGQWGIYPYIQAKIGDDIYKCYIESQQNIPW